jgi:nucleotide-binding universal stress UspA family protein
VYDRILAATDFSNLGNAAAMRAADLARRNQAAVHCVHAAPSGATLHSTFRDADGDMVDTYRAATREQADVLARELSDAAGRPVAVECREGTPHRVVAEAAADHRANLVVAGAHGQGALQQIFLGGTISRLMADIACPLLVVRKSGRQPYSRVFAAVDLGERSAQVLEGALAMTGERVTAVHVAQVPGELRMRRAGVSQAMLDRLTREHEAHRHAALARLVGEHPGAARLQGRLATGHPGSVLLERLGSEQADLLVIGRHSGGRLAERVLGSVPKFLAYHAPCDLLLV